MFSRILKRIEYHKKEKPILRFIQRKTSPINTDTKNTSRSRSTSNLSSSSDRSSFFSVRSSSHIHQNSSLNVIEDEKEEEETKSNHGKTTKIVDKIVSHISTKTRSNSSPTLSSTNITYTKTTELADEELQHLKASIINTFRERYCPDSSGCCSWMRVLYTGRHHLQRAESLIEAINNADNFEDVYALITHQCALFDRLKPNNFSQNDLAYFALSSAMNNFSKTLDEAFEMNDISFQNTYIAKCVGRDISHIFRSACYAKHPELEIGSLSDLIDQKTNKIVDQVLNDINTSERNETKMMHNFNASVFPLINETLNAIANHSHSSHPNKTEKHLTYIKNKTYGGGFHKLLRETKKILDETITNHHSNALTNPQTSLN